jgi:hypothetical protein
MKQINSEQDEYIVHEWIVAEGCAGRKVDVKGLMTHN